MCPLEFLLRHCVSYWNIKTSVWILHYLFSSDCTVQGDDTMKGTCHTAEECTEFGGISRGNCASGFGTCCVFL